MLIAHGPLGYILATVTQRWWKLPALSKIQIQWVAITAFIGGIFPDIDLVFFYFIDSSQSHRQLITHSLSMYISLLVVGVLLLRFSRFKYIGILMSVFALGTISHVFTDMITGMTIFLAPFSYELLGLISFDWYRSSIFIRYSHVTGIGIELLIIAYAVFLWIRRNRPTWLKIYYIVALLVVTSGFISLWYINEHVYKSNGFFYYEDNDNDGVLNYEDRDIDGDGVVNIQDTDINNDGEDNSLDFYLETFSIKGSLYDYSNGGFIEIPLRLGFVNAPELVERSYANIGLFFNQEMAEDYSLHPKGYEFTPSDNEFVSSTANWKQWMRNQGMLLEGPKIRLNEFDVVFFESGHVGLLTRINGEDYLLEASSSHIHTTEVLLSQVIEREGDIIAVGRILPKPIEKQY